METRGPAVTANKPKGAFACFPFRFLFHGGDGPNKGVDGNQKKALQQPTPAAVVVDDADDRTQQLHAKQGPSEAMTDSYTGGSSTMSVDPADADEAKCPEGPVPAANGATAMQQEAASTQPPPGARTIAGYEIQDTLGKGMSGKVKRGYNRTTGQYVALKVIDKATTPRRVLQMLSTEIAAMRTLAQHPNVLCLLHYELAATYPRKSGGKKDVVLLALELAEGGELFDFMMYTGAFQEPIAKAIFQQMASALAYCHEHGIYHRDIKPENLLLDSNFNLKVADFGLAAMRANPDDLLRTECGTRSYMAPEVLARHQYDGQKSDCWSAGVVLFIMLSGNPPFQMARPGDWWFNQFTEGRPDRFWKSHKRYSPHFPEAAQDLLTRVFTPNPANRPTLKEILADPWVASSTLTPDQVRQELANRRAKIIKEKEAERERARQKRAAGQYGKDGQGDFDPDKVKHRDVNNPDAPVVEIPQEPAPPAKETDLNSVTSLFTAEGPATAYRRVREAMTMMNAKFVGEAAAAEGGQKEESGATVAASTNGNSKGHMHLYTLRAFVPVDADQVEVEVRVLSVPQEETNVIVFSRKQGETLAFQRAFRTFAGNTVDLHGDADAGSSSTTGKEAIGPMPEPLEEEEGEATLDAEVDMI